MNDDAEGEELSVLWEKELDAERMTGANWAKLAQGKFDNPRDFAAYYHTLRWNTVTATDPTLFQPTGGEWKRESQCSSLSPRETS